ncbi:MAG: glutamate racemase [Bacteroidales bacterium]|nr:glutamate racemase [Bacteroidales bacterium]
MTSPIALFDSGYGGLTVLQRIRQLLPQYDYIYLGDNARNPYGSRSFEIVYQYTLQSVRRLFDFNAPLVILACNTASAKALRNIQQNDLPRIDPSRRVLGVIRPSVEAVGLYTKSHCVGVLGTQGTVDSLSYPIEIEKLWPDLKVYQQACPMWVPLVENGEFDKPGADYFVQKYLDMLMSQSPDIDVIILGCTHYPLLADKIKKYLPDGVRLLSQGEIVANSLRDYLARHADMDQRLTKGGTIKLYTTENPGKFENTARIFFDGHLPVEHITL